MSRLLIPSWSRDGEGGPKGTLFNRASPEKSTLFIGVTKTCPVESPEGGPAKREFHRVNKVLQNAT